MSDKKFRLKKGDHIVKTSLPSEAVRLRAAGYKDVKKPGPTPARESMEQERATDAPKGDTQQATADGKSKK